jgi:hypothetical protein
VSDLELGLSLAIDFNVAWQRLNPARRTNEFLIGHARFRVRAGGGLQ